MFIDEIKVYARAGHGGKGCVAFRRESFAPKGGPIGGNGGYGGSVILQADRDLNNLIAQYYQPRLLSQNGQGGLGKGMDGHAGKDLIVPVPCGTMVWRLPNENSPFGGPLEPQEAEDAEQEDQVLPVSGYQRPLIRHSGSARAVEIDLSSESELPPPGPGVEKGELVADLTQDGQQFVLCKGGRGGKGNRHFATSTHQTPRFAQPGEPGEEGNYLLGIAHHRRGRPGGVS